MTSRCMRAKAGQLRRAGVWIRWQRHRGRCVSTPDVKSLPRPGLEASVSAALATGHNKAYRARDPWYRGTRGRPASRWRARARRGRRGRLSTRRILEAETGGHAEDGRRKRSLGGERHATGTRDAAAHQRACGAALAPDRWRVRRGVREAERVAADVPESAEAVDEPEERRTAGETHAAQAQECDVQEGRRDARDDCEGAHLRRRQRGVVCDL